MAKCYAPTCEGQQVAVSFPSLYKGSLLLPRPTTTTTTTATTSAPPLFLRFGSPSTCSTSASSSASASASASAAARASKIHSEAEKRRRERINSHLSTLRNMIPDAHKMDKASLLSKVVDQVKDLKRKANDSSKIANNIPSEIDEVTVECCDGDRNCAFSGDEAQSIRVSVTCDDRPDLFVSLIQAFHNLSLRTVRADITCIGGRVQNVFVLCRKEEGSEKMCLSTLRVRLRDALARVASPEVLLSSSSSSSSRLSSKRLRLLDHMITPLCLCAMHNNKW